eukprot:1341548-Amorphochlora_amoeboformis.AAC.2
MGNTCKQIFRPERSPGQQDIAILLDFDGTIGNTETPAMEVGSHPPIHFPLFASKCRIESQLPLCDRLRAHIDILHFTVT